MPIHDWTRVDAGTFHAFHQLWIASLCNRLNHKSLPRGYFAMPEQVVAGFEPDVIALQAARRGRRNREDGPVAIATAPRTRIIQRAESERYANKADRIVVRQALGKVVSVVEIVSPGNKGSVHSLRAFLEKSVQLLDQGIHLLIVDLFPPSKRDPQGIHAALWRQITDDAVRLPPNKRLTLAAYSAGPVKTAYVEPVAVGDAMPDMPLFLESHKHVPTPLERTYQATWDELPEEIRELLE